MFEDLYSRPDLTQKVRSERGDMRKEMTVIIYESIETLGGQETRTEIDEVPPSLTAEDQHQEPAPAERRSPRASAVCLGLLCVLLLAGIIGLGIHHMTVLQENTIRYNNLTVETQGMADDLQKKMNLIKNLTEEKDALMKKLEEVDCCSGWRMFGNDCYHISTESKPWSESKQDCIEKGAHLVIINSREEQEFVNTLGQSFWIGLESNGAGWRWVDGTSLSREHRYWKNWQPTNLLGERCVLKDLRNYELVSWEDRLCSYRNYWVCEKKAK